MFLNKIENWTAIKIHLTSILSTAIVKSSKAHVFSWIKCIIKIVITGWPYEILLVKLPPVEKRRVFANKIILCVMVPLTIQYIASTSTFTFEDHAYKYKILTLPEKLRMNDVQQTRAIAISAVLSEYGLYPITVRVWLNLSLFNNLFLWRHDGVFWYYCCTWKFVSSVLKRMGTERQLADL